MNPYRLHTARIVSRRPEAEGIYTFTMRLTDAGTRRAYGFAPGQFNMLYVYGVGEVPISIVSDPDEPTLIEHTIRLGGRVTSAMAGWQVGDVIGLRGPFGTGWPMDAARRRDVIVITGGLGCAPVVAVINYIFRRRDDYGTMHIVHGVKSPNDLLYRERFDEWRRHPRTFVHLTADHPDKTWRYRTGVVTTLFDELEVNAAALVMICGPEMMMRYAIRALREKGIRDDAVYLSMERHMQCGVGLCGHCQIGPLFVCKDGPVVHFPKVQRWFNVDGL